MKFTTTQIVIAGVVLFIVVIIGLIFTGIIPGLRSADTTQLTGTITVWGVYDDPQKINETLIADFKAKNPKVEVKYQSFDPATYENDILDALASGFGPDVLMIHNTWLLKHASKLFPLTAVQYPVGNYEALFPTVAVQDFTMNGDTYAMPLYIDTLATLYNKNLFDNSAITTAPTTWDTLTTLVPRLNRINAGGQIELSAVALGSAGNVANSADILQLMMLQDGVQMVTEDLTQARYDNNAGIDALKFYTSFANPGSPNYTWNRNLQPSLDSFAQESAVMTFAYAYQMGQVKEKNPFLSFGVAPIPQKAGSNLAVNYASYWGLAVTKTSRNPNLAWNFIFESASNPANAKHYADVMNRPPALRTLIAEKLADPVMGVFAKQALTARSWRQIDPNFVTKSLNNVIESVITGQLAPDKALRTSASELTELMRVKASR